MDIKPIKNDDDLKEALDELYRLRNAEPGTAEGDKEAVLADLVEAYEDEHYPIPLPDPIGAIEYHLEHCVGITKEALVPCVGSMEILEALLTRKVALTIGMIHKLDKVLGIGVDVLAQPYETEQGYYSPELSQMATSAMAYGD